jgi:outer membrane protein assembly factor BamB
VGSSSIVTYDFAGDDQLEIIAASSEGAVSALSSSGSLLWTTNLPISRCNQLGPGVTRLFSTPAVGDLYGDGKAYVAVGYGAFGTKKCGGGLAILDAATGRMHKNINLMRLSKQQRFFAPFHTVYGTPAIGDLNGDKIAEIAFGSFDRHFYLLSGAALISKYAAADTIWSSPALVPNPTGKKMEIVLATDISANPHLAPPTKNGGLLYAFKPPMKDLRKVGRAFKRRGKARAQFKDIGFRQKSAYRWLTEHEQVLFSSPSVAELIPENPGLEIAIGSGCYFPENTNQKVGRWVRIISLSNGEILRELPLPACTPSSTALGDLNGDGLLEVAISVSGSKEIGGTGRSSVHVYDPRTGEELWSATPRANGNNDAWGGQFLEIALGDLDGNGSNELIIANGQAVHIFEGSDGTPLTCDLRECDDGRKTLDAVGVARTSPVLADINGDGKLELLIGGGSKQGRVYLWSNLDEIIDSQPGPHPPYSSPWPMFKQNAGRTSYLE